MEKLTKHGVLEASLLPYPFPWHEPIVPVYLAADVDALCDSLKRVALRWTTDKPTEEGWSWYRVSKLDPVHMVYVRPSRLTGKLVAALYDNRRIGATPDYITYDLCNLHGEWAGPLSLPMEGGGA